jgi:hypothetical protein
LAENQIVDILDQQDPRFYLIRTRPTKDKKTKIGWIPACFVDRRSEKAHELDVWSKEQVPDDMSHYQETLMIKK